MNGARSIPTRRRRPAVAVRREISDVAIPTITHRFTVSDYHRMAEVGILDENDRVELIEGEIVDMTPLGRRHQARVDQLAELLIRGLGERAIVRVQGSIRLGERSEPQPDLVVLRRRADFYADADVGPPDVLLVIEVADTSLAHDRDVKVPLYNRAAITEVWLVDLNGENVTVYREPGPRGYGDVFTARAQERLSPRLFPELVLTPVQILG
jgi:Uma2 family endonuclease